MFGGFPFDIPGPCTASLLRPCLVITLTTTGMGGMGGMPGMPGQSRGPVNNKRYYEVLGVSSDASDTDIKKVREAHGPKASGGYRLCTNYCHRHIGKQRSSTTQTRVVMQTSLRRSTKHSTASKTLKSAAFMTRSVVGYTLRTVVCVCCVWKQIICVEEAACTV